MEIIRFARNNIYRIGTNGTACAVSVPVGDTEMLELCRAIVKLEREGHTITSVMKLCSNGFEDSVNFRDLKEYTLALKEKVHVIFEDSDCRKEIRLINLDEEDMDVACLDSTILDTF